MVYPTFILVLLLGLGGLALGLVEFKVWIEPQSPDTSSLPGIESSAAPDLEKVQQLSSALPKPSAELPSPTASPPKPLDPVALAAHQGTLRVSNFTQHPVRVALLARQQGSKSYGEPAHWDFAPMEGGSQGLILSLPQGNLTLEKGDIIVAFAQDGSRLYWGPYVVGETPSPMWNQKVGEWLLVLDSEEL
ncbi:hypothetical protein IQ258_29735 [Coleofasciculus sp. LEGE 07081]|uniref:hypothetical protein n=1 Tax=Coleofasciculus sp. LEGE 07081 TaxID=2777967 RepID=UPI00187E5633|nr:hypothetical protein [Coleofasciculus sp. LEGE 07081]MBE9130201.1 hypothetical protein [Coleofasciculus sp. LEGE 07081]